MPTRLPKTADDILKLGDPRLYLTCEPVEEADWELLVDWIAQLREAMQDVRRRYGFGRGIAAPQLGILKRLIYIEIEEPLVLIKPTVVTLSEERFTLWDDCMSFPNLLVEVERHRSITLSYLNLEGQQCETTFQDDRAELVQHEFDHLEGILCTMRARDARSFRWR
ncbi:peptide deformylase [Nitritalea halalkaliphila LW7]|uniref:Peptide deformylase n=1 Tax=Nitritalea halalkaliphila LW7 TaxID=1189621 RepID=I5C0R4_9BACT|nr:peptide deformylase [Nitritalea halalkaliphila]EIM75416.1 peptide deformylase [Nitritalea halalkaliphila LW7]